MELQHHVAGGVREIEADRAAVAPGGGSDPFDVEILPGQIVNAGEQHEGDAAPVGLQGRLDVVRPEQVLARPRRHDAERVARIVSVMDDLGLDGVGVGGERSVFDQDLVAVARGSVERRQHEVQVHGEAVHHHDFAGNGPDQPRPAVPEALVVRVPRTAALEVRANPERGPVVQLLEHRRARVHGLEAEGVAAEVDRGSAAGPDGEVKALAVGGQRVRAVEPERLLLVVRGAGARQARQGPGDRAGHGAKTDAWPLPFIRSP